MVFSENPIESEFAIMQALQEQLGQIPNTPLEINEMDPNYLEENMPPLTEDEKFDINELLKQQEMSEPTDYLEEIPNNLIKGGVTKEAGKTNFMNFLKDKFNNFQETGFNKNDNMNL